MTEAARILVEMRTLGIRIEPQGERLALRPARAVPAALLDRVRAHKEAIRALLNDREVNFEPRHLDQCKRLCAEALLDRLEVRGITAVRRDGEIYLSPRAAVTATILAEVRRHKAALLPLVPLCEAEAEIREREIAWRVEAMLPAVPQVGPIKGLLAARAGDWHADRCSSCGEARPLTSGSVLGPSSGRCELCIAAARRAIERGRGR